MPELLIRVENLKKQYENDGVVTPVLFGLDFEIKKEYAMMTKRFDI